MSKGSWSRAALPLALLAACFATARAGETGWHDDAALKQAIDALVAGHKELARVGSYGKSLAGRDLLFVELGAIDDPQRAKLPALLVVAGLDGQHLIGTEMVLDHLKRLVEGYGGEEKAITKLLDEHVVYLIPRANPDGADAFFHPIDGALREVRGNLRPVDDDRDGKLDEDGPEDLNHDGVITMMRWKDPAGTLIEDPGDPRIVRPADPLKGERGVYKLRVEGLDRDGDGEWAEDGPGDVVPDRNFPQRWSEHDPGAGRVPMSEPEARALGQFLFDRPAIALTLVYGLRDNLAVDAKPDAGGDAPAGPQGFRFNRTMPAGIVKDDQPLYAELATRYRETTGVKSKPSIEADDGAFAAFEYYQFGIPALCMHVWSPPLDVAPPPKPGEGGKEGEKKEGEPKKEEGEKKEGGESAARPPQAQPAPAPPAEPQAPPPGGGGGGRRGGGGGRRGGAGGPQTGAPPPETVKVDPDEKKLLAWNDLRMGGNAFVPWTKVAHPTLGEVEVGGWKPYVKVNPPLEEVAELAKKHSDYLVKVGGLLAQVRLNEIKVENLGDGLFRVGVAVVNEGWLPTVTSMGERNRRAKPTRLDLDLGSDPKKITLVQGEKRHTWTRIEGGGGRREVKWLLQAPAGATAGVDVKLELWSERAGDDERTVTLR
jgi:zinc carboxypeptidase